MSVARIGVVGATGVLGGELVRLLEGRHDDAQSAFERAVGLEPTIVDLGPLPNVIRNISKYIPVETLVAGDVVLFNDSTLGSGHFPDFFLIMPVFMEDLPKPSPKRKRVVPPPRPTETWDVEWQA